MIRKHFDNYNFVGYSESGVTFRWGNSFKDNPYEAPWPELADVSISNYCTENCDYCYRSSDVNGSFISLEDYELILKELSSSKYGSVFQIALGGGEPLLHPNFEEILKLTHQYGIIPNYTTNGKHFNEKNLEFTKKYCGAIAISFDNYRNLSLENLRNISILLNQYDIKSNIHFVLSEKTLNQAISILNGKYDDYLKNFNSIIFLTYKPLGNASKDDMIISKNKLLNFLKLVDNPLTSIKIGFDACFVPTILRNTDVDSELVDSCECGFFSVYINENLDVMPCSFCNDEHFKFNLKNFSFEEIWSEKFKNYKNLMNKNKEGCFKCSVQDECRGMCPFFKDLTFCKII